MSKEFNINQLATTVMWWLSYTSAVGRGYVLSESALKFPIAEYLERSAIDEIELEYEHPKLLMKRFDLYFRNNKNENNVFEFKYIKNGSTRNPDEKQRIFNDLMRLYLYLNINNKSFFLICGKQFEFISNFQKLLSTPSNEDPSKYITPHHSDSQETIQQNGFYSEWFSFNRENPNCVIHLTSSSEDYGNIYKRFKDDYGASYSQKTRNTLCMPDSISTNLVFLSEDIKKDMSVFHPNKIGIWEIQKSSSL